MVSTCGKCGGEFPDGVVFCEYCGARIMVSASGDFELEDDRPFYAYQWMGETHLLTFFAWGVRYLVVQLFVLMSIVIIAAAAGREGLPVLLSALVIGSAYFLLWWVLIYSYRMRGSPTDFGGGGPPLRP